jgi:hypothetical protein
MRILIFAVPILTSQEDTTGDVLRRELFEDPNFVEEFSVYQFTIRFTSAEHDESHPTRPKLFFTASTSRDSTMEGCVSVTSDNNIRWCFVSSGHLKMSLYLEQLD